MPVGAHEKHAALGDVEGGVSSGQCAEGDWDEKRMTFEAVGWVGVVGGGGGGGGGGEVTHIAWGGEAGGGVGAIE